MFERYRVTRKGPVVKAIIDALEGCGAKVTRQPDIKSAPFEFEIRLPSSERIHLVCYAFLANKYLQEGRPVDEHRFQVKYGSSFNRPHNIYIDPNREVITLFIGVHLEEGVFIGADPAMHSPTWFSSSVEFKTSHLTNARKSGWFTWERERSSGRRRAGRGVENCQTESLIGFTSKNFLRYIQLERLGTGLDTGERMLLAERIFTGHLDRELAHPLELQFGLSAKEILDVIWGRFRLEVAVKGGVAEYHLGKFLRTRPNLSDVVDIDADGRPDFEVTFKGNRYLLECKNVLRRTLNDGLPRVDFQKTRAAKDNPCSRYYDSQSFHVLAACLHPVTEKWDFQFIKTIDINPHESCPGKLSSRVAVSGNSWTPDIEDLLQ